MTEQDNVLAALEERLEGLRGIRLSVQRALNRIDEQTDAIKKQITELRTRRLGDENGFELFIGVPLLLTDEFRRRFLKDNSHLQLDHWDEVAYLFSVDWDTGIGYVASVMEAGSLVSMPIDTILNMRRAYLQYEQEWGKNAAK